MDLDTPPEIREAYYARLRALSPEERLQKTFDLISSLATLTLHSLAEQHPTADEDTLRLLYAEKLHGPSEEIRRIFGPKNTGKNGETQ